MSRTHRIALACTSLIALTSPAAMACGPDSYLGMVCTTAATFCPRGTIEAAGQLISIQQNTALFSLLGTTYGGNGQNNFGLPDLRGRSAVGQGQAPGLLPVVQGQVGGSEAVTLTVNQMPMHSHAAQLRGTASASNTDSPAGAVPAKLARTNTYSTGAADAAMGNSAITVGTAGGNQPVAIRSPYLGLRNCVVSEGIFPARD